MAKSTRHTIGGIKKGEVITATPFLMSIVSQLNRDLDDFQPPQQVEQGRQEGEESPSAFMSCTLVTENNNDLLVLDPALNLKYVTKPPVLQGNIATRTVNGEAQIIIPPYAVASVIFAMRDIDGGTKVAGTTGDINDWQDMNVDARAWAENI